MSEVTNSEMIDHVVICSGLDLPADEIRTQSPVMHHFAAKVPIL